MTTVAERRIVPSPGHASTVREFVEHVATALGERLGELSSETRDLLTHRIRELDRDPTLRELLLASIEGISLAIVRALQYEIGSDRQEPPTAAVEYARRLAQCGVPINALVRAYRLGQQSFLRQAYDASQRLGASAEVRANAYERVVQFVFDYVDWISQCVVVIYEEEREAWLANRNNARNTRVLQILEGGDIDIPTAEAAIGHRLRGRHLAIIAWVDEADADNDQFGRETRAIGEFAAEIGGRAPLVMSRDRATAWAWVPVPRGWRFDERHAAWQWGTASSLTLALGTPGVGVEGFRSSHDEALRVQRLAVLGGVSRRTVVSHDELGVAPTALLAQDVHSARAWIRAVLGDLGRAGENAERLRHTLLMFLRHEMNYTATAETMVMHKNSIKYRLASAESALGRPVTENRLDLELALTACQWLGDAVLT